jgi:hypothetical protein
MFRPSLQPLEVGGKALSSSDAGVNQGHAIAGADAIDTTFKGTSNATGN